jgi:hypothetical protein
MRPHSRLADYLQSVEAALGALRGIYVESYQEELLTPRRANLRIRVRFANGRLLEINEAVPCPLDGGPRSARHQCLKVAGCCRSAVSDAGDGRARGPPAAHDPYVKL